MIRDKSRYTLIGTTAKSKEALCRSELYKTFSAGMSYLSKQVAAGMGISHITVGTVLGFIALSKKALATAFAVDGWHITGSLMSKKSYVEMLGSKVSPQASFGVDALIANRLSADIEKWLLETSHIESATSIAEIQRLYREAEQAIRDESDDSSPYQDLDTLAARFLESGLAWSDNRAALLSRTVTNWAYNEGAAALYKSEGINQVEWLIGEDDVTCDYCAEMDGTIIDIGDNFLSAGDFLSGDSGPVASLNVEHPPLHPNCRCCLLPVISVEDIIAAGAAE